MATESLPLTSLEIEKSLTLDNVLHFTKRVFELECFTQRSLACRLKRYHCLKICTADLAARPGAYPCFGTEEEVRQRVERNRRKDAELAPVAAEIEEGLSRLSETEDRLATLNDLIAGRRDYEQLDASELHE